MHFLRFMHLTILSCVFTHLPRISHYFLTKFVIAKAANIVWYIVSNPNILCIIVWIPKKYRSGVILSSVDVWGLPVCINHPPKSPPRFEQQTGSKKKSHRRSMLPPHTINSSSCFNSCDASVLTTTAFAFAVSLSILWIFFTVLLPYLLALMANSITNKTKLVQISPNAWTALFRERHCWSTDIP